VRMMAAVPIPKAAVSGWMVWGLGLAAVQFLRLTLRRDLGPGPETAS